MKITLTSNIYKYKFTSLAIRNANFWSVGTSSPNVSHQPAKRDLSVKQLENEMTKQRIKDIH